MAKNGLHLITPTSIAYTGGGSETATISANGSVEFSACSELRLNGVFSADYDNYMVVTWNIATANGLALRARLSSGGADNSTASSYVRQLLDADNTSVGGSRSSLDYFSFAAADDSQSSGAVIHFYGPYLTQPTAMRAVTVSGYNNAYINDFAHTHNQSTAYDGFNFYTFSGTVSGRVAVYGMRK